MAHSYNGMPASELTGASWRKSARSNPNGACVEMALLPGGEIAVRNSRFPEGPALICTPAEISVFLDGAKDGEFDHLLNLCTKCLISYHHPAATHCPWAAAGTVIPADLCSIVTRTSSPQGVDMGN